MERTQKQLEIGSRVYYTGDMANDPAWLTVVSQRGPDSYDLREVETGTVRRGVMFIGHVYQGHCDPRYVTGEAYAAYQATFNRTLGANAERTQTRDARILFAIEVLTWELKSHSQPLLAAIQEVKDRINGKAA